MSIEVRSTINAPTRFVEAAGVRYAYRELGDSADTPLLCLQHFTGTLDNWDPRVFDALARDRRIIFFENAGVGRSTGAVPSTVSEMSNHVAAFLDALHLSRIDVLGFSLGGFIAQDIALRRPKLLRKIILAGTGPEGGSGTSMNKPELLAIFGDVNMPMKIKLKKLFFPENESAQEKAQEYIVRISARTEDRDEPATAQAAMAQLQAMAAWERSGKSAFDKLRSIGHPVLVVNGNNDTMIPTPNSHTLAEYIPNATLILYPNSGHGSIYQHGPMFVQHASAFLND